MVHERAVLLRAVLVLQAIWFVGCESAEDQSRSGDLCGNGYCDESWLGDGECDKKCDCAATNYDQGDCDEATGEDWSADDVVSEADVPPACVPNCTGKQCAGDGCGGSCGTCAPGAQCLAPGKCVSSTCVADCNGKQCGLDGCGGSCGTCPDGRTCVGVQCVLDTCQPACSGRNCGADGCGGSCGTCPAGQPCSVSGQCIPSTCAPSCQGKACGGDGCGGSCGNCPNGKQCAAGGVCIPTACQPKCTGKQCGPNGCGGQCGSCSGGALCDANGKCITPQYGSAKGSLTFEARIARRNTSGLYVLDQVAELDAAGVYAVVYNGVQKLIGEGFVDDQGAFDVPLQGPIDGATAIYFVTLATTSDNLSIVLAVVRPQAGGAPTLGNSLDPWVWQAMVPANGQVGDLLITEAQGSGALFLFEFTFEAMKQVMIDLANGDETHLTSLAVLWAPNEGWSCGSCYSSEAWQTLAGSNEKMDQSIFIGGASDGSSAWGWPVILHEFGHYAARNYSKDDSPGGPHSYGVPVVAPMAWSEGWASFFAVMTMSRWLNEPSPIFWDIQSGDSFWIDYHAMVSNGANPIGMPEPQGGLDQTLDESWVAMALWDLWDGADVADVDGTDVDGTALGTVAMLKAFGGLALTGFGEFFGVADDRGAAGVDFVDFVDRIVCANPNLAQSVMATVAWEGFPYDGNADCN